MREPRWLNATLVLAIHSDQIREHGGPVGLRERAALESALDRPRNRFYYQSESDLAELAAAYGYGIARKHPFVDGNERVAFQAMYVLLGINGLILGADEETVVTVVLRLAEGDLEEPELAEWLRGHTSVG